MGGKRKSEAPPRSTVTELPDNIRDELDQRYLSNKYSLTELTRWLNELGHPISRSALGRYVLYINKAASRVAETLERTKAIIQVVESCPDVDYTKAGRVMMMDGLLQKVSTAEEEFLEMPLDKAGRLIASLSRAEVYSQKAVNDLKSKMQLALDQLETELGAAIKASPGLYKEFQDIMRRIRDQMFSEE